MSAPRCCHELPGKGRVTVPWRAAPRRWDVGLREGKESGESCSPPVPGAVRLCSSQHCCAAALLPPAAGTEFLWQSDQTPCGAGPNRCPGHPSLGSTGMGLVIAHRQKRKLLVWAGTARGATGRGAGEGLVSTRPAWRSGNGTRRMLARGRSAGGRGKLPVPSRALQSRALG